MPLATPQLVWGPDYLHKRSVVSLPPVVSAHPSTTAALSVSSTQWLGLEPPTVFPGVDAPAGSFVYLGGWAYLDPIVSTPDKLRTLLRWLRNGLGCPLVVIPWTIVKCLPTCMGGIEGYAWVGGSMLAQGGDSRILMDLLEALFDESRKLGLKVIVGLAEQMLSCPDLWMDATIRETAAQANAIAAKLVVDNFGSYWDPDPHKRVLEGLYLCDEPGACDSKTIPFFQRQVRAVREGSGSQLPLYASPYLGYTGHSHISPGTLATDVKTWTLATGVIPFFQDSVGASSQSLDEHSSRPILSEYFKEFPQRTLPNNETFAYGEIDWSAGQRPSPAHPMRWFRQVNQTGRGSACWAMAPYFVPVEGSEPEALAVYHAIRAWYGYGGRLVYPERYEWKYAFHSAFPDEHNLKLFDGKTGWAFGKNPHHDPSWVGVFSHFWVRLHFPVPVKVDFVLGNFLQSGPNNIGLPHTLHLSRDGGYTWTLGDGTPRSRYLPDDKSGECCICNRLPLGWEGVTTLDVWGSKTELWVFCSELLVVQAG